MKIHEYQGKEIFRRFGMPTPRGIPAFSVDEAVAAAESLGGERLGGEGADSCRRPRQGRRRQGRALASTKCAQQAGRILGMQLVTHQTGPAGQKVRRLLIEEGADIQQGALRRDDRRPQRRSACA